MINLLLGAPGSGKSYEATAFHLIPALINGRKVITNLPLQLEAFPPEWRNLIELRVRTKAERPEPDENKIQWFIRRFGKAPEEQYFNPNAFAHVVDYGDPHHDEEKGVTQHYDKWRHPVTGEGPLYIIDECHKPLPKSGTPIAVEEWYAEHRHGRADVLLMTQSHGKINAAIKELVQLCYRVRKGTAFGTNDRYIRKVLDGVNGTEMNQEIRTYDPTFFKYYKSHTQSTTAGKEAAAKDIKPIWKHWSVRGSVIFVGIGAAVLIYGGNPMKSKASEEAYKNVLAKKQAGPVLSSPVQIAPPTIAASSVSDTKVVTVTHELEPQPTDPVPNTGHPLAGLGIHIGGFLQSATRSMYLFTVSQNGQAVYQINQQELVRSGYAVKAMNDCIAQITFNSIAFYVTCDAPRVGVNPSASMPSQPST